MLTAALSAFVLVAEDESDWGHMDLDGGWWIVMGLGMVLFWALVILGIVWLVREIGGGHGHASRAGARGPDPLEVLDRRLAEGEIDVEEYEERRRTIRASG